MSERKQDCQQPLNRRSGGGSYLTVAMFFAYMASYTVVLVGAFFWFFKFETDRADLIRAADIAEFKDHASKIHDGSASTGSLDALRVELNALRRTHIEQSHILVIGDIYQRLHRLEGIAAIELGRRPPPLSNPAEERPILVPENTE